MFKRNSLRKYFTLILMFFTVVIGFSSWIIVGEKNVTLGQSQVTGPVAYIEGFENTKYTRLDVAMRVAKSKNPSSSNVVNVIIVPGTTLTLIEDLVIDSYINLYIPYKVNYDTNGNYTGYSWEASKDEIDNLGSSFSDSSSTNVGKNRKTLINLINADIIISSNAGLYLGGEIKNKGIVGLYSEINLNINSSIECYGNFCCYGYVKENLEDYRNGYQEVYQNYYNNEFDCNRYVKIYSGGYFKTALGIYDTKGSILMSINNEGIFPYNQFDFPNIQTYIEILYNATFDAIVNIEPAEDSVTSESATVVSSNTSNRSLFYLLDGSVSFEYCPKNSVLYTSNGLTRLFVFGSLKQGYLSVSAKIENIPATVSTEKLFLPISYKLNIYINSDGSYSSNYQLKFLPGSLLKVCDGGTLNINSKIIFYDKLSAENILDYPTSYSEAKLINNGIINIGTSGSIGARIYTEKTNDNAKIDFTNCDNSELSVTCKEYGTSVINIIRVSDGYFDDAENENGISIFQFVAGTVVTSSTSGKKCWYGEKFAVYVLNIEVKDMGYTYNVLSYEVYVADDSNGSNSQIVTSGTIDAASIHNVIRGKYFKVTAKRNNSATFDDGTSLNTSTWYQMTGNRTLTIIPNEGVQIKWTSTSISGIGDSKYTFSECSTSGGSFTNIATMPANDHENNTVIVIKNYYVKISASMSIGKEGTLSVDSISITSGPADVTSISLKTAFKASGDFVLFFTVKATSCLLPDTLVTMSDGTKKPVEQVQPGDMLKVFNHYTGEYDVSPVVFNDSEPKQDVNVINLEFSNGSNIGVVYEHGFFDLDLMKYVYIDEYNYNDYIGHRFYSDGNNIVTLNRAYITTQYTEVYSPVTAYHLNYFTEDILSMPGGIEGLFNIFEYDDDLKYNEELMKQDIEKYGLYTYDDFKDYCSYEFYQAFPAEYLKVAVGKGYITFDEIIYLINRYKNKV